MAESKKGKLVSWYRKNVVGRVDDFSPVTLELENSMLRLCDVPHLIKTTRNCWSNSFANKHSWAFEVCLNSKCEPLLIL